MFSHNFIYPLPHDGAFFAYINGNHVSRYRPYRQKDKLGEKARRISFTAMPSPKTFPAVTAE